MDQMRAALIGAGFKALKEEKQLSGIDKALIHQDQAETAADINRARYHRPIKSRQEPKTSYSNIRRAAMPKAKTINTNTNVFKIAHLFYLNPKYGFTSKQIAEKISEDDKVVPVSSIYSVMGDLVRYLPEDFYYIKEGSTRKYYINFKREQAGKEPTFNRPIEDVVRIYCEADSEYKRSLLKNKRSRKIETKTPAPVSEERLLSSLGEAISKQLGINVVVSGHVDIIIKLG